MTGPYRVLVTGARDWPDDLAGFVYRKIEPYVRLARAVKRDVIIVHGANFNTDSSVDHLADIYAMTWGEGVLPERHPADWAGYGQAAGPRRNSEMVALGANVCLAFPTPQSRGTIDCLTKAAKAGIPVHVWPVQVAQAQAEWHPVAPEQLTLEGM